MVKHNTPQGNESVQQMISLLEEGVYFLDRDRKITSWNPAAGRISGYSRDEVLGCRCSDDILEHVDASGRNLCKTACPALHAMQDGEVHEADVFLHHKQGHRVAVHVKALPRLDEDGNTIGAIEVFEPHTPERVLREQVAELEKLALLDSLTGLGNRRFLEDSAMGMLEAMRRYGWPLGALFIDLDNFKAINDRYGHELGDEVLRMVADNLLRNSRSFDTPGRWGGEEFVVLSEHVDRAGISAIAERYRTLVEASIIHRDGEDIRVTVSIGATLAKGDDTPESLVSRADKLMYTSKRKGRNRVTLG